MATHNEIHLLNNDGTTTPYGSMGGGGGSSSGGHTIIDSIGAEMEQRSNLQFFGGLVTVTDDEDNDTTKVQIAKLASSFTISGSSVSFSDTDRDDKTITVSNIVGNGNITASTSNSSCATATVAESGTDRIITIKGLANNVSSCTITVTIGETDTHTAASKTVSVSNSRTKLVSWSSGTDAEITKMVNAFYDNGISLSEVKSVWSVGDARDVSLSAMAATGVGESHRAQTVQMQILDFEHDTLTNSVNGHIKALITVDQKNCLMDAECEAGTKYGENNTENGYINSTDTNVNGWRGSARRTWCNDVYYNALPDAFKSLVKQVDKLISAGNQSSDIETTADYCFLPSEIEFFYKVSYSKAGEGSIYVWYAQATANRYKSPHWYSSSVTNRLWGRSPSASNATEFCFVIGDGNSASLGASRVYGLAPAMCL